MKDKDFDLIDLLRRSKMRHIAEAADEIEFLRHWRQYAIDRLGVGPELVAEIDRKADQLLYEQRI
jgi:hypothetical protein